MKVSMKKYQNHSNNLQEYYDSQPSPTLISVMKIVAFEKERLENITSFLDGYLLNADVFIKHKNLPKNEGSLSGQAHPLSQEESVSLLMKKNLIRENTVEKSILINRDSLCSWVKMNKSGRNSPRVADTHKIYTARTKQPEAREQNLPWQTSAENTLYGKRVGHKKSEARFDPRNFKDKFPKEFITKQPSPEESVD